MTDGNDNEDVPAGDNRVQVIDDNTRTIANALRMIAGAMEDGRARAIAVAYWGLDANDENEEPGNDPFSQNLLWENSDPNIPDAAVPLLGSVSMLRTRLEHGLLRENEAGGMPSIEDLMAMMAAPTDNPQ